MSTRLREVKLESYLAREAKRAKGFAFKLVCPGTDGMVDRMVVLPGARVGFLELKAPGQKPAPLQLFWMRSLGRLGFLVDWADSRERVDYFLERLRAL